MNRESIPGVTTRYHRAPPRKDRGTCSQPRAEGTTALRGEKRSRVPFGGALPSESARQRELRPTKAAFLVASSVGWRFSVHFPRWRRATLNGTLDDKRIAEVCIIEPCAYVSRSGARKAAEPAPLRFSLLHAIRTASIMSSRVYIRIVKPRWDDKVGAESRVKFAPSAVRGN